MTTPGFPAGTLDEEGMPRWLAEIQNDNLVHTMWVVRGLEPAAALPLLDTDPEEIRPCVLPATKNPDDERSLAAIALGLDLRQTVIVAGRVGDWTFVFEDSGYGVYVNELPAVVELSRDGQEAASTTFTINGDVNLEYAADGQHLFLESTSALDPERAPDRLLPAFAGAGVGCSPWSGEDDLDDYLCLRVLCALAGLALTPGELRQLPLLAAPYDPERY
ncbi:DUF6461 domain-containing protein [Amycolatopsis sp. PS_44_ISF1]|uniref:DUF6461 domain-containing protein n=1 Tax=Amycolatopsis sp. PS_44_ISF1 TaxID=2974917 RepID=UPI0028DFDCE1|nr:DUF6461 domain-containing protein [Amycolatopsis sp. PS_44_ISF1]MDT8912056.1 DUF6461 domain-containing protein [Amycolatopsis sp. PS_44_ISF1]